MELGETLTTVLVIFITATLLFIFPLMSMSDRTDDVVQEAVKVSTTQFVDNVRNTGVITQENYSKFIENIHSTGNTYDVSIQVGILDENPGKKATQVNASKIGENVYYYEQTSQIEDELNNNGSKKLKEGDIIAVSVNNTNLTLSQQLKNIFYTVTGNNTYTIAAEHSGIVTATGK